jgi:hypothetical protein
LQFPAERDRYKPFLQTALGFLRSRHLVPATGGYKWTLNVDDPSKDDATNRCYGLAFALLAYSTAFQAGVKEARVWIDEAWDTLSARFWEEAHGLYADEATADWSSLSPYRGQNANMHACEAHMAAFDATGDEKHLFRARRIAHGLCVRLAAKAKDATGACGAPLPTACGPLALAFDGCRQPYGLIIQLTPWGPHFVVAAPLAMCRPRAGVRALSDRLVGARPGVQ